MDQPLKLQVAKLQTPIVIIPIYGWNRVAEMAVRFGLLLSDTVLAIHVSTDKEESHELRKLWAQKVVKPAKAANFAIPQLEITFSPYRRIYQPILDQVKKTRNMNPDRLIVVILPQIVEPHWYEYVLHNMHAAFLRSAIFRLEDRNTVVIDAPWYLREPTASG